MDVEEILKLQSKNPLLNFTHSELAVSQTLTQNLQHSFLQGTPLSYLMGFAEFYYRQFYVNEAVLTPRPETEYMVDLLIQEFKGKVHTVLDVGTGSGVILLSLLNFGVGESGVGVDLSAEALKVTRINTDKHRLTSKVKLLEYDRLEAVKGKFDLIVSNPPYIKREAHLSLVHPSVNTHEPHVALYLPDAEYTIWFETFFRQVYDHLEGTFMMEGHELELETQAEQLRSIGFKDVSVLRDLTGTKRFLKAHH
jgi:release factor glutamine methyltransferase